MTDQKGLKTPEPTVGGESGWDDALPRDGKYVLCKDEVYMVSSSGNFQLLPEVAPSIGYKLITTTLSSTAICKNGAFTDEASAMSILFRPMRMKAENESAPKDPKVHAARQQGLHSPESAQLKKANPQRLEVRWEKAS